MPFLASSHCSVFKHSRLTRKRKDLDYLHVLCVHVYTIQASNSF